jgi:predicted nucleic acid-binding protein
MIILDTNALSALMRTAPAAPVVAWLDRQPAESVWITSITVLEARLGLAVLWRVTFRFDNGHAADVDYMDYH